MFARGSTRLPGRRRAVAGLVTLMIAAAASGCSVRKLAIGKIGGALAGSGGVYATDDDPELVGAALPFALKTMEGLAKLIVELEEEMVVAADELRFEEAARIRDELKELRRDLESLQAGA